jgi:DNA-binding GntR family transcriptional regulator
MNIAVDEASPIPYYAQARHAVKAQIACGEKPIDMLATGFRLSERLGIRRLAVHRAYRELATEGPLIRKRGRGNTTTDG